MEQNPIKDFIILYYNAVKSELYEKEQNEMRYKIITLFELKLQNLYPN